MPSPSSSLSTLRPDLGGSFEEFNLEANNAGAIATRVLPVMEVGKQAGKFGIIPVEELLKPRDTKRASGGGYNRSKFKFEPASYACDENGAEEPVDDREATMYTDYFDAEVVSAARCRADVIKSLETRVSALVFNTTTWTGASLTTAVGVAWSTYATATPVSDVEGALQKIYTGSGQVGNALILGWKAYRNLRQCAQVIDRIKYAGFDDPKNVSINALATLLGIEQIIVGGMVQNSANEGAAASLGQLWSASYTMVAKVATSNDIREACIGRIFHWSEDGSQIGGAMETYRDETVRSNVVRCRMDTDEAILYPQCGHLLSGIGS